MSKGLPVLGVAATLVGAGILRAWQHGSDGWLLAGAGLVIVGIWVAAELLGRNDSDATRKKK